MFVSFNYLNSGFSQVVVLFCRFVLFKAQIHRVQQCSSRLGSLGAPGSQGDPGAVVFEFAGQHPTVELVKLHQLDQVCEACVAVVQTEEHLPFVIHLQAGRQRGFKGNQALLELWNVVGETHRHDLKVFDSLHVAQRQDERLWVALAVPQKKHSEIREGKLQHHDVTS